MYYISPSRFLGRNWFERYFYQSCPYINKMEDFDLERYASKKWFLTNRMLDNSDEFFDYGKGKCDYH